MLCSMYFRCVWLPQGGRVLGAISCARWSVRPKQPEHSVDRPSPRATIGISWDKKRTHLLFIYLLVNCAELTEALSSRVAVHLYLSLAEAQVDYYCIALDGERREPCSSPRRTRVIACFGVPSVVVHAWHMKYVTIFLREQKTFSIHDGGSQGRTNAPTPGMHHSRKRPRPGLKDKISLI